MPPGTSHSTIHVRGADIHWAELGTGGRPLVLLHGLCDSHRTWASVAPALARSRRVLMPDLAGHGLSSRPDATYSLDWHARVVCDWLEALGLAEVDLVGHSYGGGVAQWTLLQHRERTRRLALVSSGGLGREVGGALRLASLPHVVERFGQAFMARGTAMVLNAAGGAYSVDEIVELSRMNAMPGTARAFARSVRDVINWRGQHRHFLDRAHEIDDLPPVALFWGDRDTLIPVAHAIKVMSVMDGAALTRFPDCGHFPHRQEPERFARELVAFLDAPTLRGVTIRDGASDTHRLPSRSIWQRSWFSSTARAEGPAAEGHRAGGVTA